MTAVTAASTYKSSATENGSAAHARPRNCSKGSVTE